MATIVEMINPLTGLPEQVDKLDHTAQEIDYAVGLAPQLSNPNLLDNWYFGNPVNQRGQTEYTGAGYGIDRWKLNGVDGGNPVYLVDTHELINNSTSGYAQTVQIIPYDFAKNLIGKILTLSVLVDDGFSGDTFFELQEVNTWTRIAFKDVSASNQVVSVTFTMPPINNNIQFYVGTRGSVKPIAAALNPGDHQTAFHKDSEGNWQLNELPNYADTLARCQKYLRVYNASGSAWYRLTDSAFYLGSVVAFGIDVDMRTIPVISFTGSWRILPTKNLTTGNGFGTINNFEVANTVSSYERTIVIVSADNFTPENDVPYAIGALGDNNARVYLSAEL